ncbi:hypothetical protein C8Q74DRAFT_752286 [Fomes fomentarius]|nr:hypothetical protein C8Q74DRAFT_752286 [Fomes fomentarius]
MTGCGRRILIIYSLLLAERKTRSGLVWATEENSGREQFMWGGMTGGYGRESLRAQGAQGDECVGGGSPHLRRTTSLSRVNRGRRLGLAADMAYGIPTCPHAAVVASALVRARLPSARERIDGCDRLAPLHPTSPVRAHCCRPRPSSTTHSSSGRLSPSGSRPARRGDDRSERGSELGRQRRGLSCREHRGRPPVVLSDLSEHPHCPSPLSRTHIRAPLRLLSRSSDRRGALALVAWRAQAIEAPPLLPSALPGRPALRAIGVDGQPGTVGS